MYRLKFQIPTAEGVPAVGGLKFSMAQKNSEKMSHEHLTSLMTPPQD